MAIFSCDEISNEKESYAKNVYARTKKINPQTGEEFAIVAYYLAKLTAVSFAYTLESTQSIRSFRKATDLNLDDAEDLINQLRQEDEADFGHPVEAESEGEEDKG